MGTLIINGIPGTTSRPNVLSSAYKYAPFKLPFEHMGTSIDVSAQIQAAWSLVGRRATQKPCNDYFKSLVRGKTLKEVLAEGDITLHCLVPKEGHKFDELPIANSAGRDIAIHPDLLLPHHRSSLACTLIHELAHVAGATTNTYDENAGAAELALKSCECSSHYIKTNLGRMTRARGLRVV